MIPLHFCFLAVDTWIYDIEVSAQIYDGILIWLNFFNYMTLHKVGVGIEVIIYGLGFLISLTHMKRVIFDVEGWTPFACYLV